MIKTRKKALIMALIGGITGIMMAILFNKPPFTLPFVPLLVLIGGLIGMFLDRRAASKE